MACIFRLPVGRTCCGYLDGAKRAGGSNTWREKKRCVEDWPLKILCWERGWAWFGVTRTSDQSQAACRS